jgi:hypothetical protein
MLTGEDSLRRYYFREGLQVQAQQKVVETTLQLPSTLCAPQMLEFIKVSVTEPDGDREAKRQRVRCPARTQLAYFSTQVN